MNALSYKVIFSKRLGTLVAVGEHASAAGKSASGQASRAVITNFAEGFVGALRFGFATVALACLSMGVTSAQSTLPKISSTALPQGSSVNSGSVSVSTSGSQMALLQTTDKASVNWQSFNIGSNASVNIVQPSASAVMLNRVVGNDPSQILGKLSANGQVILLNPNGIAFGKDGSVTASSFTASTFALSEQDFAANVYKYQRNGSTAQVVNQGTIQTQSGGFVALVGASVTNEGKITAPQGDVVLAAAESVTLPAATPTQTTTPANVSVRMSKRVRLEVAPAAINTAVTNAQSGVIVTEGGQVLMQAASLSDAVASVTHSGRIDTTAPQAGAVTLLADGGQIKVDGSMTANSTASGKKGADIIIGRDIETGVLAKAADVSGAVLESNQGFVETSGDYLATTGVRVKAGEWLLDPTNITIAASGPSGTAYGSTYTAGVDSVVLASDINNTLNLGTNVTMSTSSATAGAGNININESISKTTGTFASLTLRAHNDITLASGKTITSTSGNLNVTLNSDFDGSGSGAISLGAGSGITSNGGNITLGGGTGGAGAGYAAGYASVMTGVSMVSSSLNAGGGNISIKGKGNTIFTNTSDMRGVNFNGATVSTSGVGTITIDGVGGNGNVSLLNVGIGMTNSSTITGGTGAITMTGTATTTAGGYYNSGIWVYGNGSTVTGAGAISMTGTGGGSTYASLNQGIRLEGGRVTATGTGTVTLVGTPGAVSGTAGPNAGIEISGGGYVQTNGGSISITGNSGGAGLTGVLLQSSGSTVNSSGGNITFTTDSYSGDTSATVNAGSGTVTIQNRTGTTTVNVGGTGTDTLTGTLGLDLSSAELAKITAAKIVVGRNDATGSGAVTVSALNMGAMGNTGGSLSVLSGGNIAVNDSITKTAGTDATLSLLANNNITVATNKTITASTGKLNVLLNSDSDASGAGSILFNSGSGVTSNGGNITLGGGSALDGSGTAVGDGVSSYAGISLTTAAFAAGGGNIAMTGTTFRNAATNTSNVHGILVTNGSINTTGAGTIALKGYSNTITDTLSKGIQTSGVTITGGSTGTVSLLGDSRSATAVGSYLYGVSLGTSTVVTSLGGNIEVTGYGGNGSGTFAANIGVNLSSAKVTGVGAGTVTITGTGGQGAAGSNMGVWTTGASTAISSQGTDITIIGQGGNGASSEGIFIGGGTVGVATGTTSANVILTSDSTKLATTAINSGTGTTTIQNKTAGTLINVGGADVLNTSPLTLGITNAEMNLITAGTLKIGSATSGAMTTSATVTTAATTGNLYLQSGSTLTASTAFTSGAGLLLQTAGGAISTTAALSGTNVSLDNTAGTINWTTGALTAGASSGSATNAVNIASSITATGNVNILGNVATSTHTGVNLTSAGSITSSGTAATVNINANGNIANAAAIKNTGSTGTGANINITSSSGTITGAGAIGDTTNKNASVTFTQAGTSTYSGAINAANFTKAGVGALTLDSWTQTTPVATNISNAYTVNDGGSLTLSPGATYAQLNPASVNVVNASTFALSQASNGRLSNTAFNFTGGLGGGTMSLGGNHISAPGSTNTFSTSGGATNTIAGMFNANSANVNMNLTSATSGTTLLDGSFAALAFTQNSQGGFGLQNGGTVNVSGGGHLLIKDKVGATAFNINAGNVQVGDGTAATASATATLDVTNLSIAAGSKLTFNRAEAYSNASVITGTGSLIQAGTGVVTLTGNSNAFAGATTVNAGKTLAIGTGGSLGAAGSTLALTDATSTLSFTNTSGTSTVASTISGLGTVTENGAGGTGVLAANNTYSGITTVTAGTLQIGNGGATGTLGSGSVTNNAALVLNRDASSDLTVSAVISGTGTLTQAGVGKSILTGANTYTGATTVNAGTLSLGTTATTGTASQQYASSQFTIAAGATLDFNAPTGVTLDNRGTILTGAGTLTKTGGGTLKWNVINDTTFNMLAGSLIDVKEGTFVGSTTYHGKWTNNLSSLNVASGATFQGSEGDTRVDALTGAGSVSFGWSTFGSLTVGVNNTAAGVYNTTAGTATFSGVLSGPAPLNKMGTGTQTLTGTNTYSGTTTISAGTLQVGNGGATGTLGSGAVVDNAALIFNRDATTDLTVSGAISGTGTVTQAGAGKSILTGTNTYSGTTTISAGTLQVGNGGATGTLGSGAVVDNAALVFNRNATADLTVNSAISGTGTLTQSGAGKTILAADNSYSGATTISAGTLQVGSGGTTGTLGSNAGAIANSGVLTINRSNAFAIANVISGTGALTQAGGGTTTLTGTNTYSGTTTISAGTLQVGNGGATGTLGSGAVVDNAALIFNRDATTDLTVSGAISGTGTVTQTGAGKSILTGTNTYSGTTTISAGTLKVGNGGATGTLGSGAVTVTSPALLDVNLTGNYSLSTVAAGGVSGTGNVTLAGTGAITLDRSIALTGGTSTLTATSTAAATNDSFVFGATTLSANTLTFSGTSRGKLNDSVTTTIGLAGGTANLNFTSSNYYGLYSVGNSATLNTLGTVNITGTYTGTNSIYGGVGLGGTLANTGGQLTLTADASTSSGRVGFENGVTGSYSGNLKVSGNVAITATAGSTFNAGLRDIGLSTINATGNSTLTLTGNKYGVVLGGAVTETATKVLNLNVTNSGTQGIVYNNAAAISITGALALSSVNNIYATGALSAAGGISVNAANTSAITGVVSGTSSLTKTGASTLVLNANNTYTGGTTITTGTLNVGTSVSFTNGLNAAVTLGSAGSTGSVGSGAVVNNVALVFNRNATADLTVNGAISGTGTLTQSGAGKTILAADNSYSGATSVSGGTLQIGNAGATGTLGTASAVTLSNSATLAFNKNVNTTIDKTISGDGNVTANITGELALTSNIALTGTNTINLTASGSITETAGSLAATNLYMTATNGGIGATGNRIQSNVTNLSFSGGGDVFLTEANAVTVAGRTTANNGSIDVATTLGTLTVNAVNSINGITANGTGNITLSGNAATGHGLSINKLITATNGDVSLTGTTASTTYPNAGVYSQSTVSAKNITMVAESTATSGTVLGYYGAYGVFNASQSLSLTGISRSSGNGLYTYGGSYLSGTGMTVVGTSAAGQGIGFDRAVTVTNSTSGGISMTGTATQQAIGFNGVAITNGGGALTITANNGRIDSVNGWGTNTITNSGTGAVQITAGNGSATNSGSIDGSVLTITQNANAGVVVSTSGTGNVTSPKIINAGTGDIVVAAGTSIAAGTGTGGQILTVANNTLTQTNATPGKTYVYSGSADTTGVLSNLSTGFASLYYQGTSQALNTGFNQAFDANHANDLSAPGGTVASTQVFFRSATQPGFSMTLANASKAYGESDPTLTTTSGTTLINAYAGVGGNNTFAVVSADVVAGLTGSRAAGENVGTYAYTLSGSNFNTTLAAQPNLVIGKRDITLATITASNKTYNGSDAATISSGTFGNLYNNETLAISGAGTFSDKNVATGKTVTVADVTALTKADGTGAWSNYNLTTTGAKTTTANITQAALSITATQVTKTYDGGLSASGTGTVGALAGVGDSVSNTGSQTFVDKNVATGKTVTASGVTIKDAANADMTGNYNITYVNNTTSVINKANLSVTANADARFVTQTDAAGFKGVSYNGFVGGETSAVLGGALSLSRTNALTDVAAATYTGVLVPTGLTASNYNISYTNGNYTVVPADRLLVNTTSQNVTYGNAPTYTTTAKYLDSTSNTIKVLTQTGTNNNYTYNDGVGTTISLALKPYTGANVATLSTSGNTVVGTYDVKDTAYVQNGNNFNGVPVFIGTLTVDQKALTPSATGVSKVYDGTTSMGNMVIGMTGKVNNDVVSISGNGAFSQKNVGANLGYAITGVTLASADAGNYFLSGGTNSFTGNDGAITAASLVITSGNVTKVYDRTTTAAGVAQAATGSQTFGSDSLSGGTFAFTSAAAGAGNKAVTVSGVTVNDGNNGNNYSVTYANNTTSTITQKALTASMSAANKTYDGTTTASVTGSSTDIITGDTVTFANTSATFANKNVGTGKPVTVSGISLTGTDAGNYSLQSTTATASANITQAALSITATQVTKTYDGGLSASGTGTVGALAGVGDSVSNTGSQAFVDKNVATGKTVTASGVTIKDAANADMTGNYNITYVDNTTSVINKANLSVTANADARFVTQTDATGFNGVSYSGFVGGETSAVLGGALSLSRTNALTDVAAATYTGVLVPTGLTSDNYTIGYTNGNYTIVPADRLLVTTANQNVTYGTTPTYTTTAEYLDSHDNQIKTLTQTGTNNNNYTYNDGVGTTISLALKPYTGANVATLSTSGNTVVGTYDVKDTAYVQNGNNFNGVPVFIGTLTVDQKALTPSATGVSKVYDGTTSMGNMVIGMTGKINNDVVSISGNGAFSQKNVGANLGYSVTGVTLASADAGNYVLSGGTNSFTGNDGAITAASLVITSGNVTKVYDRTTTAAGVAQAATGSQTFGSDSLSGGTFAFTTAAAGAGNKTVTVSGVTVNDGNNGNNYSVTYANNTTSTITQKALTASMSAANKTYDGTTTASVTGSSTDIITGDTVTFANTSATFANKNVGTGKPVTVAGISLTGTDAGNYSLQSTTATTTANVTAKSLTAAMIAANKTYDGTTTASVTGSSTDIITGDTVAFANTSATFANANVGTGKTVTVAGISLTGTDAGNYSLQSNTATALADILASNNSGGNGGGGNGGGGSSSTSTFFVIPRPITPTESAESANASNFNTAGENNLLVIPALRPSADSCTPTNLEDCLCETQETRAIEGIQICYQPKKTASTPQAVGRKS